MSPQDFSNDSPAATYGFLGKASAGLVSLS